MRRRRPVVDALVEKIAKAQSRVELNTACRALDRVLRAAHYWIPMWYRDQALARLLGRVLAARAPAEAGHRRARHLVVGRGEGEEDRALSASAASAALPLREKVAARSGRGRMLCIALG